VIFDAIFGVYLAHGLALLADINLFLEKVKALLFISGNT